MPSARPPGKDDIAIEYERDGKQHSTSVALKEDERLGVYASTQVVRLDPITSARLSFSYVVQTAEGVMRLLQPQHTMEILDQSSSIVGISVMSSQAAAAGPATFLSFAALISFSLGFMNLLPTHHSMAASWSSRSFKRLLAASFRSRSRRL